MDYRKKMLLLQKLISNQPVKHFTFVLITLGIHFQVMADTASIAIAEKFVKNNRLQIMAEIVDASNWIDKAGNHTMVVCQKFEKELCSPGYKSAIYGYQFTNDKNSARMDWKIQDFSTNACESVQYLKNSLIVKDIDGDSIMETRFCYEFSHDCCDPIKVKYLLHAKKQKYAIRGQVPMESGNSSQTKKDFDTLFASAPPAIKAFASADWDQFIKKRYGDMLE
jgi:hypothetical protein